MREIDTTFLADHPLLRMSIISLVKKPRENSQRLLRKIMTMFIAYLSIRIHFLQTPKNYQLQTIISITN